MPQMNLPKLFCNLTGHIESSWKQNKNTCYLEKICIRCGDKYAQKRISHQWSDWKYVSYISEDSCKQQRACSHCKAVEKRTSHHWGNWKYISEDSCKQQRACSHCKAVEKRSTPHRWEAHYVNSNNCDQLATCIRCGMQETRHNAHQFSIKEMGEAYSNYCYRKECTRCGYIDSAEHDWEEEENSQSWYSDSTGYVYDYTCTKCGAQLVATRL